MSDQLTLTAVCVLPGCTTPVVDGTEPCMDCQLSFGPRLRRGGRAITAAEIAERDAAVRHTYAQRAEVTNA